MRVAHVPGTASTHVLCKLTPKDKMNSTNPRADRPCHPGPCPSCMVTIQNSCHCGKSNLFLRCSQLKTEGMTARSCGAVCGRTLGCGKHQCQDVCHDGACQPCVVVDEVRCYCGRETKSTGCGEGVFKECEGSDPSERWTGRFQCKAKCDR